ncbi:MAG: hypothetical protein DI586_05840 [Micavibrio aeruginosavorus]|uniref:Uncharacterized protein n=1 Tax=Micavibrio aeruginosavorus TaxID=349221 RepID=A0A2W5HC95_9BACT|nr:MAG: hypothetical protein DI586_05840 [Micavibrio aeruginosavorus]
MALSKLGYALAFGAAVAGFAPANDYSPVSQAYASAAQASPVLSVGCMPKSELQKIVFNQQDQNAVDNGGVIQGKIGVKDQFYSVNPQGEVIFPVKTTVGYDYNGKDIGKYNYLIEADDKQACIRHVIRNENSSGVSQIAALRIDGASVVAEGHNVEKPNQIISVLMKGSGGNTFNTEISSGKPIAIRSHNREVPDRFKILASLSIK